MHVCVCLCVCVNECVCMSVSERLSETGVCVWFYKVRVQKEGEVIAVAPGDIVICYTSLSGNRDGASERKREGTERIM